MSRLENMMNSLAFEHIDNGSAFGGEYKITKVGSFKEGFKCAHTLEVLREVDEVKELLSHLSDMAGIIIDNKHCLTCVEMAQETEEILNKWNKGDGDGI